MKALKVGAVTIPAADLSMRAVRSSGPGGQNVNKVSSKVELRLDLAGTSALDGAAKARLRALTGAGEEVIVTSQAERDRARNLEDARAKLARLVARALAVPKPRKATRPTAGSKRRRLETKKARGAVKKQRRGDWSAG